MFSPKKILLLLMLFILSRITIFACTCEILWNPIHTKADIAEFDFVSIVKVLGVQNNPADSAGESYLLKVAVTQSYKGNKDIKEITVFGNSYYNGVSNSCDLSMHKNDTWLLFGNKKDKEYSIIGNICQRHELIEYYDGSKPSIYYFKGSTNQIRNLNRLFQINENKPLLKKTYFPNYSVESVQEYKNEQLNGKRLIFFPNYDRRFSSKKRYRLNYKNGKLEGKVHCWNEKGELNYTQSYLNGIKFDSTIYYYETQSSNHLINDFVRKEKLSKTRVIDLLKKPSPYHIEIYNSQGNLKAEYYYYLSGTVSQERLYDINGNMTYRYFDIEGNLDRKYE